jgi:hypothetical protein
MSIGVQVRDSASNAPVPRTLVVFFADGKPVRGAITIWEGLTRPVPVPKIAGLKVRTFLEGYKSTEQTLDLAKPDVPNDAGAPTFVVRVAPLTAAERAAEPRASAFVATGADGGAIDSVPADSEVSLQASLAAAAAADPLAPEAFVIEPNNFLVAPLTSATPGADGSYKGSSKISFLPGTYNYYLAVRSRADVSGPMQVVSVTAESKKPTVRIQGQVVAADDGGAPIPDTIVTVEMGGAYVTYNDSTRATPYYQFGGVTNDAGMFDIPVPDEQLGTHTFADGFQYGVGQTIAVPSEGGFRLIKNTRIAPALAGQIPTASGFVASKTLGGAPITAVAPGEKFYLSATLTRGDAGIDPLSDEIIVAEPAYHWIRVLNPPSAGYLGALKEFPDGRYWLEVRAPSAPPASGDAGALDAGSGDGGVTPWTLRYYLVYTSEGCIVGNKQILSLTVQ